MKILRVVWCEAIEERPGKKVALISPIDLILVDRLPFTLLETRVYFTVAGEPDDFQVVTFDVYSPSRRRLVASQTPILLGASGLSSLTLPLPSLELTERGDYEWKAETTSGATWSGLLRVAEWPAGPATEQTPRTSP